MDQKIRQVDHPVSTPETHEKKEGGKREHHKLRETSREFVEGVAEVVGETGEVSEEVKEGKKVAPTAGMGGGSDDDGGVAPKAVFFPKIELMQGQIAKAIRHEIETLEKEARKMTSNPMEFKPFALNGVVAKIRELKDILANLTHVTMETLKTWWLKYVKKAL